MMAATCVTFCACSSDDDGESKGGGSGAASVVVGPSNVFTGLTPKSAMGASITYNSNGQVTRIVTEDGGKYDFTYGEGLTSRAANTDKTVKVVYTEDGETYVFNMEIGNNGFVKYCEEIEPDGDLETWEFGYNSDNQLNYMKRSEGGNEVTNITYQNGDIIKVTMRSEEEGVGSNYTISYTSADVPTTIENKGCLMLFDVTFGIDMDEFAYIYYAGLLGKATKNLPVSMAEYDSWKDEEYIDTFVWEVNENGYPIKMTKEAHSYFFTW